MMPKNKEPKPPNESGWKHVARSKGYACIRCGNLPEYDERETYFETKLCGWCLNQSQKDD
jgi:hypothetical protein